MSGQPFHGAYFIGEKLSRDARPRDAQIYVAHHAAERTALDEQRECRKSFDQRLTGIVMAGVGFEGLSRFRSFASPSPCVITLSIRDRKSLPSDLPP